MKVQRLISEKFIFKMVSVLPYIQHKFYSTVVEIIHVLYCFIAVHNKERRVLDPGEVEHFKRIAGE